jgi:hypothetical protein
MCNLGGLAPDEVPLVVHVRVLPGERPAHGDPIALMVLDKAGGAPQIRANHPSLAIPGPI